MNVLFRSWLVGAYLLEQVILIYLVREHPCKKPMSCELDLVLDPLTWVHLGRSFPGIFHLSLPLPLTNVYRFTA